MLQFQNLKQSDLQFTKDNTNLICTITQTGETMTIKNWGLGSSYQVDAFAFKDGILSATNMKRLVNIKSRVVHLRYPSVQTLSGQLSWSHYCKLLAISDEFTRSFYEKEATNSKWSVRELKRQIATSLFEQLLLSEGDANKEKVLQLAQEGINYHQPQDILRNLYVFEFLASPEDNPVLEKDLEKALTMLVVAFENSMSLLSL